MIARSTRFGAVLRMFVLPFAILTVLSVTWALASPLYSIPDENAHAAKAIAQARGQIIGYQTDDSEYIVVDLPDSYRYAPQSVCFVFDPEISASCASDVGDPGGTAWFDTWVGAYDPTYYALVAWPTLFLDGAAGIYGMRIVSALLCSILLAGAFALAAAGPGARWRVAGAVFLASPVVLYFAGSVNPNGLEVSAAALLWAGMLALTERLRDPVPPRGGTMLPWVGVAVGASLLANARAIGPLWVVVIVGACLLIGGRAATVRLFTTRSSYVPIGIVAASGLFSVVWTLTSGNLSGQAEEADAPLVGAGFLSGFVYVLRLTPVYLQQAVGVFGWLDTTLPGLGYAVYLAPLAFLVVLLLSVGRRREVLLMLGLIAGVILIPAIVQGVGVSQTGIIWQGRYGLALYIGIPLVAGHLLSRPPTDPVPRGAAIPWFIAAGVAAYSCLALLVVERRYVTGVDEPLGALFKAPEWQPPLGWLVLLVLHALCAAAAIVVFGRASMAGRISRAGGPSTLDEPEAIGVPTAAREPRRAG